MCENKCFDKHAFISTLRNWLNLTNFRQFAVELMSLRFWESIWHFKLNKSLRNFSIPLFCMTQNFIIMMLIVMSRKGLMNHSIVECTNGYKRVACINKFTQTSYFRLPLRNGWEAVNRLTELFCQPRILF
jgi:hypothetical protein